MPQITSVKQQKSKNRVNVYLDGKFSTKGGPASGWGFGIDLVNFVKFNLHVGDELTQEKINEIIGKSEHQKILDKLLSFAMLRPRSEEEIKTWLRRKKIPEDMHKNLFETLSRLELLDDEKFARWWIDQRLEFGAKSKKALKYELVMKGIDKKVIEVVFGETDIDEESLARKLLEKKKRKWGKLDRKMARQKMQQYLARQGFSFNIIKKVI